MAIGVRLLVHGLQEQGKRHDFGSEGHTYDTEEGARACQRACSAPGPTPRGAWRLRSHTPTAYRLPLQQGKDCLRAGVGLRQGKGAGL